MDTRLLKLRSPTDEVVVIADPHSLPVWPPPERLYAVKVDGQVVVADASDPGALDALSPGVTAQLYERQSYSALPEQAHDSFVKRGAEYKLVEEA